MTRIREQMRFQSLQRQFFRSHRNTVVEDMQVGFLEVDYFLALRIPDVRILDVPFLRYGPIKYRCSGWQFMNLYRNIVGNYLERLPHSFAGNAAADGIKFRDKLMDFFPYHHGFTSL